jgi:carbonic anhydrase/acetyltransferase-like protein (isoleucine patch superfamily)
MALRSFEGRRPLLAPGAWVDELALAVGDVELAADASLWPFTVARGDIHHIRIGARSNIQDGSVLHVTHDSEYKPGGLPLLIGEDVTVGHKAVLHACTIGDRCLIGMGAVVLDGAVVESETYIGAGALVPPGRRLAGGHLYLGSPVRQARPLTGAERAYLRYSAEHYVRLKNRHLSSSSPL